MDYSDKPDCSKCAIKFDCDTAYSDKCWLVQAYMEQSEYIEQKIQEMLYGDKRVTSIRQESE